MYVDVQPRRAMLVAFSAAFAFLIFGFLVGVAGPDALISTEYFAYEWSVLPRWLGCGGVVHRWRGAGGSGGSGGGGGGQWR